MLGRHAFGLLLLLATSVPSGYGQQPGDSHLVFTIGGNVRDNSDLHGVENVRVELRESSGAPVSSAVTRSNGAFEFAGIDNGEYILDVKAPNYEPLQQPLEIMNSGRRGVSLLLTRISFLLNSNLNGAVISAHQLSAPRKAQGEFDKGMTLLYGKSDYLGAITQFQRAIKDFPNYYEAYALEGTAYQSLGEMPAAEEALRKSVELSSERYSDALYLLSALLVNSNRYEEAATLARKCADLDSASWQGHFELARALFGLKQFDEAAKNAVVARDRNPANAPVYILMANIDIARRDLTSLAADLDSYLMVAPDGPDADWVQQTQERLRAWTKEQTANPPREGAQGKSTSGTQDRDGEIAPDPDEPDSSALPPIPPQSSTAP